MEERALRDRVTKIRSEHQHRHALARVDLLPGLVQRTYADAKASFEKKDPKALPQFEQVLTLLDDPDLKGVPQIADYFVRHLDEGEAGVRAGFIGELMSHNEPVPNPAGPQPARCICSRTMA